MSMNDPLGDMLTRIRNAQMRGKSTVRTPASKLRAWVLDVLKAEGYIRGYEETTTEAGHKELEISLKYYEGTPVIRELARVSKPGRRVYASVKDIPQGAATSALLAGSPLVEGLTGVYFEDGQEAEPFTPGVRRGVAVIGHAPPDDEAAQRGAGQRQPDPGERRADHEVVEHQA